jgi:short-subunit dehydrogenase
MDTEPKYALITGGSRGIGKALAREFAGRGMNLLLVARNQGNLNAAAREIKEEFPVHVQTLQADLSDPGAAMNIRDWCRREGYRVNILVNNAGIAGTVKFETADAEYFRKILQVNVSSMVSLTRLFLPELATHPEAYVLNIGSMSAYFPLPYKTVYAASKAFVRNFSVSVTVINPNGVRTSSGIRERIDAHSWLVRRFLITDAHRIARISVNNMMKRKAVMVPGLLNRLLILVYRLVPHAISGRYLSGIFRKEIGQSSS